MICSVFLTSICKIVGVKCVHIEVRDPGYQATHSTEVKNMSIRIQCYYPSVLWSIECSETDFLNCHKICDPVNLLQN